MKRKNDAEGRQRSGDGGAEGVGAAATAADRAFDADGHPDDDMDAHVANRQIPPFPAMTDAGCS